MVWLCFKNESSWSIESFYNFTGAGHDMNPYAAKSTACRSLLAFHIVFGIMMLRHTLKFAVTRESKNSKTIMAAALGHMHSSDLVTCIKLYPHPSSIMIAAFFSSWKCPVPVLDSALV